jgi:hypothetical protein
MTNNKTPNLSSVCDQVCNKILNAEFKGQKSFFNGFKKKKTKKPLRGSQT